MIHPGTVKYNFDFQQFVDELALLKSLHPQLRAMLDHEMLASRGSDWTSFIKSHRFTFREDSFDGLATMGTLRFCRGRVILTVILYDSVILPTTFDLPKLRQHLP